MRDALLTEQADVCFSFGVGEGNGHGLEALPVWDAPLATLMPQGHALAGRESLTLAEALAYEVVLCEPRLQPGFVAQFNELLGPHATTLKVAAHADSLPGLLVQVSAGWGLGFMDAGHAGMLKERDLKHVPLSDPDANITTFAITKHGRDDVMVKTAARLIAMAQES